MLAFGLGTGYDFSTSGLIPTSVVVSAVTIGLLRAAYESASLEVMRAAGIRRRVVLVGAGESLVRLRALARVGAQRARRTSSSASSRPRPFRASGCSARAPSSPSVLDEVRPDEVILAEADFDERAVLEVVEQAHRQGIKVRLAPDTTELLVQRGEYVPGQGAPLFELRPPVLTGWDWAVKRGFDLVVERRSSSSSGSRCGLLIALAIKLDSRGPVFFVDRRIGVGEREFGMLKFRTMVADAAGAPARARGGERGRGRALQDPRRPARDARRPVPAPVLARRDPAGRRTSLKGEMSLVGPRPLPLRDYRLLEDWHRAPVRRASRA